MVLDALIAPSLLACDAGAIRHDCGRVMEAGSDWLHIDVMDGHFVPNLSFFDVASIRNTVPRGEGVLDIHMMVSSPETWVDLMAKNGADSYTFHVEATQEPLALIRRIHDAGMRAACALKPKTPASAVFAFAHALDMILVMTVEPGFGGQKFMPEMMSKVKTLREKYPDMDIQVDGGVSADTVEQVAAHGANCVVSGTGIFKAKDTQEAIASMRAAIEGGPYNVRASTAENLSERRGGNKQGSTHSVI